MYVALCGMAQCGVTLCGVAPYGIAPCGVAPCGVAHCVVAPCGVSPWSARILRFIAPGGGAPCSGLDKLQLLWSAGRFHHCSKHLASRTS